MIVSCAALMALSLWVAGDESGVISRLVYIVRTRESPAHFCLVSFHSEEAVVTLRYWEEASLFF